MQGLLLKLSALDADAGNALRVIGFFDRLITSRASLEVVVRSTAALAECPAGIADTAALIPAGAMRRELPAGPIVWIDRAGPAAPLDDILLERFAIAIAVLLEDSPSPAPTPGDPALVELIISPETGTASRSRALHLLGIDPASQVRVAAVSGQAVVMHADKPHNPSAGTREGIGPAVPALEADRSWRAAQIAWRLTSAAEPVLWADQLGSIVALAERLTPQELAQLADISALDRLAATPHGAATVAMLEALCRTGSARQAAAAVHRHHSTLPARLAQAEAALGFPVSTPAGRFRLHLALMLLKLSHTES